MIFASLLLILVAVTLLVLGLTGGSSGFLISSIVASLLAAVALVIGARQTAGSRRAAAESRTEPEPQFAPEPAEAVFAAEPEFAAATADGPARRSRRHDAAVSEDLPPAGEPFAADSASSARPENARDTVQFQPDAQFEPGAQRVQGDLSADEARAAGRRDAEQAMTAEADQAPDYDRASSVIGAARSGTPDEHAWRRDPDAPEPEMADEFDEPDADDPDDEPLPQRVEPADAVRIARMDAEVLVVDGRPRYHLADCPHLVGRLTEPIPVNEAVDLGFSPCGLCRPVDRLVAASAHR